MKFGLIIISILTSIGINAQDIYKTPSGKKYHLSTCRMVENVSEKLKLNDSDVSEYHLTPCKICKPPAKNYLISSYGTTNKAVGETASQRCRGHTQRGTRCKHMTSIANGYCYQHTSQNSSGNIKSLTYSNTTKSSTYSNTTTSSTCGARTKSGGACKRKVKGFGFCYQHK